MASNEPRWHPEAIDDALEARDWYSRRSPLAARGFLLALDAAVYAVTASPKTYAEANHGCRKYVFPNQYPYTLVYRLLREQVVEIVAVANQLRQPEYWSDR
ncbi:MAG TPA: type II toxin-antitoxin system RelE/ParE family toxin [Thermoanaerobaculia bacterium]|nr:type II toxin-antitoxin system RelE/ParE family toxin [Thermoanaerobaculia bacterium]